MEPNLLVNGILIFFPKKSENFLKMITVYSNLLISVVRGVIFVFRAARNLQPPIEFIPKMKKNKCVLMCL